MRMWSTETLLSEPFLPAEITNPKVLSFISEEVQERPHNSVVLPKAR